VPSHVDLQLGVNQPDRPSATFFPDGSLRQLIWQKDGVAQRLDMAADHRSGIYSVSKEQPFYLTKEQVDDETTDQENNDIFWQADRYVKEIYDQVLGRRRCSFCAKDQTQVATLIAAPSDAYICDECVNTCAAILSEQS
jgi:hypothetical protein